MTAAVVPLLSLAVWAYLLVARGWFWLGGERDDSVPPPTDVDVERARGLARRYCDHSGP